MKPEPCPRCFAPAREDGRPDCACAIPAETAAESTAEDDHVETLDMLHTRPYVSLHNAQTPGDTAAPRIARDEDVAALTAGGPEAPGEPEAVAAGSAAPAAETEPLPPVPPSTPDFVAADDESDPATPSGTGRRKTALLVAGAVVVVAAAVAIGAGVLGGSGGSGTSDAAAAPNSQGAAAGSASAEPSATDGPTSAGPSDDPSRSPGASADGSVKDKAKDIAASAAAAIAGSPDASGAAAGSSASADDGGPRPAGPSQSTSPSGPPVLREGDTGPEVVELQKRMGQLLLQYVGMPDGTYDAGVERAVARYQDSHHITGDPSGVYGAATRADLESRTKEP
ncbi:peptidoglycan-binding domain-containing protein [Streptomyces sp. NBC_00370]|uniref:peptidoglycan-binding domain-containing protein n=2 Tax=unclassified Streptomyces TaxID=2593676 RepID=UPI002E257132